MLPSHATQFCVIMCNEQNTVFHNNILEGEGPCHILMLPLKPSLPAEKKLISMRIPSALL